MPKLKMIKHKRLPIFLGVFFISFATLMLEIGMTRIFSVLYEYHYAFLAVALAISGLGAGGIFFHAKLKNSKYEDLALVISGQGFGMAILLMLFLVVFVSGLNVIYFTAILAFLPFLFAGIFLSASFELFAEKSGKLYAIDLIGAALGSFLVIFALNLGGVAVALVTGLLASLSSILIRVGDYRIKKITIKNAIGLISLPLALLVLLLLNILFGFLGPIPFSPSAQKEMLSLMNHPFYDAQIEETRWSHFGRTDLVKNNLNRSEMVLFIDGTAGAPMYRFNGDFGNINNNAVLGLKRDYTGYFPISHLPPEEKRTVLIIGPGGGRDILAAKLAGAEQITAVEINPDFVKLARKYKDYNGGIFDQREDISVVVDEGRSFLKRLRKKFDIIFMSIPITKTSRSPEGYALSENFLFTVDSMSDYLEHLTENGRIIVVAHHDLEIFKLLFLTLDVYKKKGINPQEALKHIYTIGPPMFQVFVLKKSPITKEEAKIIHDGAMLERHYQAETTFIPHISQHLHEIPLGEGKVLSGQMINEVILAISEGRVNPDELIKAANVDLKPNSDNNPFFYKMKKGLPEVISILLILSFILAVFALLIKPRFKPPTERALKKRDFLFRYMFFSIGVAFMLIEIPLIQKFTLFLGQPVYSLSALLLSLLVGAGIGSYMSGRIRVVNSVVKLIGASLLVAIVVLLYLWILPSIFDRLLSATINTRIFASVGLILPVGLVMGVPFPSGIKLLHTFKMTEQVPRMWGINGLSSVFGSVLAVSLSIIWGFTMSLIVGAFLYFLICIIFSFKKSLFLNQ